MLVYSNFGEWAIPQAIAEDFDGIRCDNSNGQAEPALANWFIDQPISPLFLLHDVAMMVPLLDALLPVQDRLLLPAIEIFNELEGGRVTPEIYVKSITQVYDDARSRGFTGRIITGGLANLSLDSLNFYARVLPLMPAETGPMGLTVGFHDYPYGVQSGGRKAWPGTESSDAALQDLLTLTNGRDLANTEFGWHTYPEEQERFIWKHQVQLTDEDVYRFLIQDLQRYEAYGIVLAAIYQWRDGGEGYLGRFGLHTADGVPKRQLDAVKDWRA